MLSSPIALLNVYDLVPQCYAHYVYLSHTARAFKGDIARLWLFAPTKASVAAVLGDDGVFDMQCALVNRARFNVEARAGLKSGAYLITVIY
jgi:hypothetical protein